MACQKIGYYLDDFLSGRLLPAERGEIEAHISTCPECKKLLEQDKKLLALLKFSAIPDPGEEYWLNLEKSILSRTVDSQPTTRIQEWEFPKRTSWRYIPVLAAVIILLMISISSNLSSSGNQLASDEKASQYVYEAGVIGDYYFESPRGGDAVGLLPDLMEALPLSAPGSAAYNLAIIMQVWTPVGGHN